MEKTVEKTTEKEPQTEKELHNEIDVNDVSPTKTIIVGDNDTLTIIAYKHRMSLSVLKRINHIGEDVFPGQILKVFDREAEENREVLEDDKSPEVLVKKSVVNDGAEIISSAAKEFMDSKQKWEAEEKKSENQEAIKGMQVNVENQDEKKKKDSVDSILDQLEESKSLKNEVSYMTMKGEIKGSLMISPDFLIFDPKLYEEKKPLFSSTSELIKYQCFIDTKDICECVMVVLPNPAGIEDSKTESLNDYYLQLFLSSVEGELQYSPMDFKKPSENREPIATVHFKLSFENMPQVPNTLRKRITLIIAKKIKNYFQSSSSRKFNLSSTSVPFFDRHVVHNYPSSVPLPATTAVENSKSVEERKIKLKGEKRSNILTEKQLASLGSRMSPIMTMRAWELIFNINSDGTSLHTFYANVKNYNPTLLVVQDTSKQVFGAFASARWTPFQNFFGTGQSFLFSFKKEELVIYRWTGLTEQFQLCDQTKVIMGGGGNFGLVLDDYFSVGSSDPCETFNNECLASSPSFKILNFEVLGLQCI